MTAHRRSAAPAPACCVIPCLHVSAQHMVARQPPSRWPGPSAAVMLLESRSFFCWRMQRITLSLSHLHSLQELQTLDAAVVVERRTDGRALFGSALKCWFWFMFDLSHSRPFLWPRLLERSCRTPRARARSHPQGRAPWPRPIDSPASRRQRGLRCEAGSAGTARRSRQLYREQLPGHRGAAGSRHRPAARTDWAAILRVPARITVTLMPRCSSAADKSAAASPPRSNPDVRARE